MGEGVTKSRPLRDLRGYGRLEALNALLVPGFSTYYGWPRDLGGGIVLALANSGLVIGLVVGALYWLALAKRVAGNPVPMGRALQIAHWAQIPMLVAVGGAATWCAVLLVAQRGLSFPLGVAVFITFLAALEYVNYYHVQLQHFDNPADWRRLLGGRRFRAAHMARDLAKWRRRRQRTI